MGTKPIPPHRVSGFAESLIKLAPHSLHNQTPEQVRGYGNKERGP